MFPVSTREVSDSEMDEIESAFDSYGIPYSVGTQLSAGTQFNTIAFKNDGTHIEFVSVPTKPTQTVKQEPVKVNYHAVFVDNAGNRAAMVEYEDLEAGFLPELRQAFHEGESFNEREADYRYHFDDGTDEIAVHSSDPVDRLEETVEIVGIEYIGGFALKKWLLETSQGDGLYLRERSGSIRLYDSVDGDNQIFNAYIGGEHPGTPLTTETDSEDVYNVEDDEIIQIITSVNYIKVIDKPSTSVSEEIKEAYDDHLASVYEMTRDQNEKNFEEIYEDVDWLEESEE